jgi:hypothetical protein
MVSVDVDDYQGISGKGQGIIIEIRYYRISMSFEHR